MDRLQTIINTTLNFRIRQIPQWFFSRPGLSLVPRLVAHQSNTKSLLHSAHWMTVRHMHLLYISYSFLLWWCYVIWYILISNCDWFILKIWKTKGKWKLLREGKKMVKEDIATIDLSLDTSDASRWVFFCDFFEFAEPVFFLLQRK